MSPHGLSRDSLIFMQMMIEPHREHFRRPRPITGEDLLFSFIVCVQLDVLSPLNSAS
jgi:hypothetical protein